MNGPTIGGLATTQINAGPTDAFELVNFARKTNVTINTGSPEQTVIVNNSVAPPGLSTLTINTSNGDDDDRHHGRSAWSHGHG